jgi:hypothetical protein
MTKLMRMVITEKLDGTNAQICITRNPSGSCIPYVVQAGSRKRWITPEDDNFGFAKWVQDHRQELIDGLGEGRHFGEWAGPGIQKNKHKLTEKTFFLFNVLRWHEDNPPPECCSVVPVLYDGDYSDEMIESTMCCLKTRGSEIGVEVGEPEGIIIFLPKSKSIFKRTFKYEEGKWGKE